MEAYVADFETIVNPEKTRVWLWGFSQIGNVDNFDYNTTIESFIEWCKPNKQKNKTVYFHNLKFDGEFLFHYLLTNGYKYDPDKKEGNTFNCIVSNTGAFYSIEIIFKKFKRRYEKVTIYDSYKKLPMPVSSVGKAFGLPYNKIEVEEEFYTRYRPEGHVPTQEEIDYLEMDVKTVAMALGIQFDQDLKRMTVGSDALASYKKILGGGDMKSGELRFKQLFPVMNISIDTQIRYAYKGGFTYANPKYAGKDIDEGIVYDLNSLYPWVMRTKLLPYGVPLPFLGKYEEDEQFPLYIQKITCSFKLKKDHIPTIQIKGNRYKATEYLTTSEDATGDDIVSLVLTNVDLELFLEHYDVEDLEYEGGWKFKGATGLFDEFIDYWSAVKIKAAEEGNDAMYTLSKLMLNNLYGKFATNPDISGKHPILTEDNTIKYVDNDKDLRDPVYTAMGAFITAYAREKTIRSCQDNYDRFIYADTDSKHLIGTDEPEGMYIHPTELGAWGWEGTFKRGRFLRAKTYIEEMYQKQVEKNGEIKWKNCEPHEAERTKLIVTCAGMPDNVKEGVTWDNFHVGLSLYGKKMPKHIDGGLILEDTYFTIT